jgi:hypothetical protein
MPCPAPVTRAIFPLSLIWISFALALDLVCRAL